MVEKGLQKGAVFTEGSSFYKVEEVLPDGNYISRRISEEEAEKLRIKDSASKESTEEGVPSEAVNKQVKKTDGRRNRSEKNGTAKKPLNGLGR